MSSGEAHGGGGGGARLPRRDHYCHECRVTVSIAIDPNSELACPNCGGGFLQEAAHQPAAPDPISLMYAAMLDGVGGVPAVRRVGGGVNFGDYFMGANMDQLIAQISEDDPNKYGTPPAAKSVIEVLPDVMMTEELMGSDCSKCVVCQYNFEDDMVVKQLPCKHLYHSECIIPWLELHSLCPICRYQLPTDDAEYEENMRRNISSNDEDMPMDDVDD